MKKIIGIIAAVAMAASVFAVEFSAGTKILLNAFQLEGGKVNVFTQMNDSHSYAMPNFALNISGDKAGAAFKITTDGGDGAPTLKDQAIWFKPFDMLKITVGAYDVALNKETIDWTESITALGGEGLLVSLNIEGFALDVGLDNGDSETQHPSWQNWWLTSNDGKTTVAHTFVKVGYSADFGSVGAFFALNHACGQKYNPQDVFYMAYSNKENMSFGAGYKGAFGPVSAFANVVAGMFGGDMKWIRPEIFVSGGVDAFGFALFVAPGIFVDDNPAQLEVVAKLTYGLGKVTPYFYFKSADLLAKTLGLTFKLGATGSVGVMGYDACIALGVIGNDVTVDVPVALTVSF